VVHDSTSYTYNGDGVLVSDGTTTYAQDLAAPLSQVLSDGTANYVYGHARLRALGGPWYVGDALGSVRQTLDDAGAVLATTNYDPWGTPQGTLSGPFGFTGELHSAGQVYLRARWYAPGQGRFVSEDPFAGFPHMPYSLHAYQYAYSDPVRWTDPSGRCTDLGSGSRIHCEPGEEPLTPAEAEALCGPKPPSHPRTGPTYICNPQQERWEPLLKTGTIVVGGLPSLGRAVPGLGRLPQLGKAGVEACTNLIGGTLAWVLTQANSDAQTRRDDDDGDIAQMRVQLQRDNTHTTAIALQAPASRGVSTEQVRRAMESLWRQAEANTFDWFPSHAMKPQFATAIVDLSTELKRYPTLGVHIGGNILRSEWTHRRRTYRIDIENLRGHNLRR